VRFTLPLLITIAVSISFTESSLSQNLEAPSASGEALAFSNIASRSTDLFGINPTTNHGDSLHEVRAGAAFAPFRGGLTDASTLSAGFCYYSSEISSSLGLSFSRLGFQDLYSDQAAALSYTKEFPLAEGRKAYAGIRGRYERIAFTKDYEPIDLWLLDLGFQFAVTNEFYLGGSAQNLLGASFTAVNSSAEEIARVFSFGFSYYSHETDLVIHTAIEKQPDFPLIARFGAEYQPTKQIAIRAGTTSEFVSWHFGLGLDYEPVVFDAAILVHSATGISLSFGLSIRW
jgi:hypothetical protein